MRVVTVVNYKGGVTKSTSTLHLAAALAAAGERVLVADGDESRGSLTWAQEAQDRQVTWPFPVVPERSAARAAQERQATLLLVDAADPQLVDLHEIAQHSDLVVVPTTCDGLALEQTARTIRDLRSAPAVPPIVALLSRVPPPPSIDGQDAAAALQEAGIPVLGWIPELSVLRRVYDHRSLAPLLADAPGALRRHEKAAVRRAADAYAAAAAALLERIGE